MAGMTTKPPQSTTQPSQNTQSLSNSLPTLSTIHFSLPIKFILSPSALQSI
ncbi:unnamed protein product [Meloidogyne enterolobii]|uniref:Uncharacterized protein n=1 Tax=Meloidogyne enterolobii TaxID=390850 RepID=A0ACB1B658_MELEN